MRAEATKFSRVLWCQNNSFLTSSPKECKNSQFKVEKVAKYAYFGQVKAFAVAGTVSKVLHWHKTNFFPRGGGPTWVPWEQLVHFTTASCGFGIYFIVMKESKFYLCGGKDNWILYGCSTNTAWHLEVATSIRYQIGRESRWRRGSTKDIGCISRNNVSWRSKS
jgi:hypothetical protein